MIVSPTSGARACHLATISLRAKSVQTECRQGASLSAQALCSDSKNQKVSRPVELGQLALPGGERSPLNAEKAPELSPSRRPHTPYNPRTRENSYARGGRRQNRQNLQKGLLEVLEALASGKSSRILIGETSVHAIANRAQRRARMPIWSAELRNVPTISGLGPNSCLALKIGDGAFLGSAEKRQKAPFAERTISLPRADRFRSDSRP